MNYAFVGAMLNSALYLVAVFAAGQVHGNVWAWKSAIAAMGVTYLSYLAQCAWQADQGNVVLHKVSNAFVWLSIALGVAAGLALLF